MECAGINLMSIRKGQEKEAIVPFRFPLRVVELN